MLSSKWHCNQLNKNTTSVHVTSIFSYLVTRSIELSIDAIWSCWFSPPVAAPIGDQNKEEECQNSRRHSNVEPEAVHCNQYHVWHNFKMLVMSSYRNHLAENPLCDEEWHLLGCYAMWSCKNRRFGRTWRLLHQGDKNQWTRNNASCNYQPTRYEEIPSTWMLVTASVIPSSPILVTLMKEALSSSVTSVITRPTRRNIPEDAILHSHYRENLKSSIMWCSVPFWFLILHSMLRLLVTANTVPSSPIPVTSFTEETRSPETSVLTWEAWHHISEDCILQISRYYESSIF
jgi:hypothetical protein